MAYYKENHFEGITALGMRYKNGKKDFIIEHGDYPEQKRVVGLRMVKNKKKNDVNIAPCPVLSYEERKRLCEKAYKKETAEEDLVNYGGACFLANKELSQEMNGIIKDSLLDRHTISSFLRTKMVDWMYEVLSAYHCNDETFFLSVYIMDMYFAKTTEILSNNDVHLIGMVSMFIASKFEEMIPIFLVNFVKDVGHDLFKEDDYLNMEQKILKTIGVESLVNTSTYEIIKTLFCDFIRNNLDKYPKEFKTYTICIKEKAFSLAKIMLHYNEFYSKDSIFNAVGCILAGAEFFKEKNSEVFDIRMDKLYSQWIQFLCLGDNLNLEDIRKYSLTIKVFYANYLKEKKIDHNVIKNNKKILLNYE